MSLVSLWTTALLLGVIVNLAFALHGMIGVALEKEIRDFVGGDGWAVRVLVFAMVLACALGGILVWIYIRAILWLESRGLYRPQGKGL